ncbi:MAG TPA: exo-beta-N-acetylmuramidase NamZ domain-containing protein [Verrucomicrobiae bacterium]
MLPLILLAVALSAGAAFDAGKLRELDDAIVSAVTLHDAPGAVLWLEHKGEVYSKAFGARALIPMREPMTDDTIFDAASLTKVVATTPAMMLLIQEDRVKLDAPVKTYLTEFAGEERDAITVRHLMTHTSGLRAGIPLSAAGSASDAQPGTNYARGIELACAEKPQTPPGTAFKYSDVNFILLGEIVRRVSGEPLNEFYARHIFHPLKMDDTGFLPVPARVSRIAPTERADGVMLRGVVHDPPARRMGGVAGHAGLFTTADDLARYCRMLLNGGELDGVRLFKSETVALMTSVQTPTNLTAKRGLGWDIDTGYSAPRGEVFPVGSNFGHTGFTGTSLWLDPASKTFVILLTSRLHPDGKGNVADLRRAVGTHAADAVGIPRQVLNGIDVLKRDGFKPLKKLRVGLVTNHTGADHERNPTIDLLHAAPDVKLVALFSPEHGIRGALDQAKISDSTDAQTGLPVFSLYGERRAPTTNQLANLDALVFDIQDIGCRFYTYVSTMGHCLEAAAKAGKKFFVLDRVNPINGVAVEGPVHEGKSSFVAYHRVPLRHGMTVGELARMFDAERGWNADLTVIRCEGWRRAMWFDETGLPWINPSPNIRSLRAATLYPGVGLLEIAISVGRGTETPFELVGAPYVDEAKFAAEMSAAQLPGVSFAPAQFTPTASTFKDQSCGGATLTITDREKLNAVDLGLVLAQTLQRLYPTNFALAKMSNLLQSAPTLEAIRAGKSLDEIKQSWATGLEEFRQRRAKFLLY